MPPKHRSCLREICIETIECSLDGNSTEVVVAATVDGSATAIYAIASAATAVSRLLPLASLPYKQRENISYTRSVSIAAYSDGVEICDGAGC